MIERLGDWAEEKCARLAGWVNGVDQFFYDRPHLRDTIMWLGVLLLAVFICWSLWTGRVRPQAQRLQVQVERGVR